MRVMDWNIEHMKSPPRPAPPAPAHLDHIGFSPELAEWTWSGRVAVAEYDAQVVPDADADAQGLASRDRHPSDHRPVVLDIAPN